MVSVELLSDKELKQLIREYKNNFPVFEPKWIELTKQSIQKSQDKGYFNHCSDVFKKGVVVYKLNFSLLWNMLYKPEECYCSKYLWSQKYEKNKIAKVIYAWAEKKLSLSPITVVCHLSISKLLISDGNHRFSVLRYLSEINKEDYEVLIATNVETSRCVDNYAKNLNLNIIKIYP